MINERIHFRIFICPLCSHQFCWVNPRLPSHCPECGGSIIGHLMADKARTVVDDPDARLRYHDPS